MNTILAGFLFACSLSVQLDIYQTAGQSLADSLEKVRAAEADSVQLVACEFFFEGEERQSKLKQLREAIAFFERAGYPVAVWTSTLGYGDDGPACRIRRTKGFRRMAAHMGGWDIFPRLYTSGLWRPARLEVETFEKIDQVAWVCSDLANDGSRATLAVMSRVRAPFARYVESRLVYTLSLDGEEKFRQERPLTGSQQLLDACEIRNVKLWWPRGWGDPTLYDAKVELVGRDGRILARDERKIGFRNIRLEYADNYGPENPGQFLFRVNGQPCYIRGTNWVPLDAIHSRDMQHLESTLALVEDLNCNMIRVWGGGDRIRQLERTGTSGHRLRAGRHEGPQLVPVRREAL